jgi:hypothetical protein
VEKYPKDAKPAGKIQDMILGFYRKHGFTLGVSCRNLPDIPEFSENFFDSEL